MERAFVDANVAMYAAGAPHSYRAPCVEILGLNAGGSGALFTDAETLQEILYVYMRREGIDYAREVLETFDEALRGDVVGIGRSDVLDAAYIDAANRLDARDRIHLAVMNRLGVRYVISTDGGFDNIPGVTRLDPLTFHSWRDSVFGESP